MRRRHPLGAFASVLAVYVLFDALPISLLPMALAIAAVAALSSRRSAVIALAATALAIVVVPLLHSDPFDAVHVLLPLAMVALAVAAGRRAANVHLRPIRTP